MLKTGHSLEFHCQHKLYMHIIGHLGHARALVLPFFFFYLAINAPVVCDTAGEVKNTTESPNINACEHPFTVPCV